MTFETNTLSQHTCRVFARPPSGCSGCPRRSPPKQHICLNRFLDQQTIVHIRIIRSCYITDAVVRRSTSPDGLPPFLSPVLSPTRPRAFAPNHRSGGRRRTTCEVRCSSGTLRHSVALGRRAPPFGITLAARAICEATRELVVEGGCDAGFRNRAGSCVFFLWSGNTCRHDIWQFWASCNHSNWIWVSFDSSPRGSISRLLLGARCLHDTA